MFLGWGLRVNLRLDVKKCLWVYYSLWVNNDDEMSGRKREREDTVPSASSRHHQNIII